MAGKFFTELKGKDIYFDGTNHVLKNHSRQTGDMIESENSRSANKTMGGPAPGEPDPARLNRKDGK